MPVIFSYASTYVCTIILCRARAAVGVDDIDDVKETLYSLVFYYSYSIDTAVLEYFDLPMLVQQDSSTSI